MPVSRLVPTRTTSFRVHQIRRFDFSTDLVVTSLFYDTGIFMVNLLIVFSDAVPESMVVDVLALEFFTLIDDEFKTALLQYDDSFLDDMLLPANYEQDAAVVEPSPGARSAYSVRSSSWRPSPPMGGLTQTLFDVNEVNATMLLMGIYASVRVCCTVLLGNLVLAYSRC